jgi:hypothetical protein
MHQKKKIVKAQREKGGQRGAGERRLRHDRQMASGIYRERDGMGALEY